jgi:ergothioneine biosynthesis protein EgtB
LTRPTLDEVLDYRRRVDAGVLRLLARGEPEIDRVAEVGIHHEQQHQELLLADVKHLFAQNPLAPAYRARAATARLEHPDLGWVAIAEGIREIGHAGPGFHFDNEAPRHRVALRAFEIADRLATNREIIEFIDDGGYRRPELWLDAGWDVVRREGWNAPLYFRAVGGEWYELELSGLRRIDPAEPAVHLSYFEADAFARFRGARLPTEAEWEVACAPLEVRGNFVESGLLHPRAATAGGGIRQAYGDAWEWTSSAYAPYPGYRPLAGALGEYNGKFMCGQLVLRGGSCATPASHVRATYRNFFPPAARWQFAGVRLARDLA